MNIRELERDEVHDLWSIDRAEVVDEVYRHERGQLVRQAERHDTAGWPPGEPERDEVTLLDCFDHGGTFYGAFEGETLIGAAVLEGRFIGRSQDQLQLKFLHVGRAHRRVGLGRTLFEKVVTRACRLGARRLYISSTSSVSSVDFYLGRGCRVTDDVDAELFALEPEDIHLELEIPK